MALLAAPLHSPAASHVQFALAATAAATVPWPTAALPNATAAELCWDASRQGAEREGYDYTTRATFELARRLSMAQPEFLSLAPVLGQLAFSAILAAALLLFAWVGAAVVVVAEDVPQRPTEEIIAELIEQATPGQRAAPTH